MTCRICEAAPAGEDLNGLCATCYALPLCAACEGAKGGCSHCAGRWDAVRSWDEDDLHDATPEPEDVEDRAGALLAALPGLDRYGATAAEILGRGKPAWLARARREVVRALLDQGRTQREVAGLLGMDHSSVGYHARAVS